MGNTAASAYKAIPVDDSHSIQAWAIQCDGKIIGAAWTDEVDDLLFFHVRFIDGKVWGKAELMKSIIPKDAWITVPFSIAPIALYLKRKVGLTAYEPFLHNGEFVIPLHNA